MLDQFLYALPDAGESNTSPTTAADVPVQPGRSDGVAHGKGSSTIRELLPYYFAYVEYEWRLSKKTLQTYADGINRALRVFGDITPQEIDHQKVLALKADIASKGAGASRVRGVINALRSFLRFCRLGVGLEVLDPKFIRPPRVPRREVVFLTPEEVEKFLSAIPVFNAKRRFDLKWLGFRALVEVLLGTGMRISEALSIERSAVNFETGEARIVGKGNKERTVFFTPRALGWLKEFANHRSDSSGWLFVLPNGKRLLDCTVRLWFGETRVRSGLLKKVTPHIMRHTMATTLLFNGCPIGFIKELLGHDRLETTCQYYLGVDKKAAKEAHRKYLNF
jgi:site-specific recombinase XerD